MRIIYSVGLVWVSRFANRSGKLSYWFVFISTGVWSGYKNSVVDDNKKES